MAEATLDALKKKILEIKQQKEECLENADHLESKVEVLGQQLKEKDDEIATIIKREKCLTIEFENLDQKYNEVSSKLNDVLKEQSEKELELQSLNRRLQMLDESNEATDTALKEKTDLLHEYMEKYEDSERIRKVLETRTTNDEERIFTLEKQLGDIKWTADDSDHKYDETCRKLMVTEVDLERTTSRLELAESKVIQLEEELKIVGNNLKSLEISSNEAYNKEEEYEATIKKLREELYESENKAAECDRVSNKRQQDIDRLEEELMSEKKIYKEIASNLDLAYAELGGF